MVIPNGSKKKPKKQEDDERRRRTTTTFGLLSSSQSDKLSAERHPCGWVANKYSGGVETGVIGHGFQSNVMNR